LLDAGADSEWNGYYGASLIEMARERGHDAVAIALERARDRQGRTAPAETQSDNPIHLAAETGNLGRVRELLDADPELLNLGDHAGGTPLHRAVIGKARRVVELLLDRGADIHAIHGAGLGAGKGFSPHNIQAIDLAIWGGCGRRVRRPRWRMLLAAVRFWVVSVGRKMPFAVKIPRLLLARGATHDLTVASALGDFDRVQAILNKNPSQIRESRPNGRRPLTTAVEFSHEPIARFLLERGANPTWPELNADRGGALHAA